VRTDFPPFCGDRDQPKGHATPHDVAQPRDRAYRRHSRAAAAALTLILAGCQGPLSTYQRVAPVNLPATDRPTLGPVPLPGKVTVVEVFAPWCEPCGSKVQAIERRRQELENLGAHIVYVALLENGESAREARNRLDEWGATGVAFYIDRTGEVKASFGLQTLPATFVFDSNGTIRWRQTLLERDDAIVRAVDALR
jgi:thiol-disulfide isomerase/thioredoxin